MAIEQKRWLLVMILLGGCEAYDRKEYASLRQRAVNADVAEQNLPDATDDATIDVPIDVPVDTPGEVSPDATDATQRDVVCEAGTQLCSDQCVDLTSDAHNCGRCGHGCATGLVCTRGVCCGADIAAQCPGRCIDTRVSPAGCDSCGQACAQGVGCSDGACTVWQAARVIQVLNDERQAAGCPALELDSRLMAAAQWWARDMAVHDYAGGSTLSDGSDYQSLLSRNGFEYNTQKIALSYSYPTPDGAANASLSNQTFLSGVHNCAINTVGVGFFHQNDDVGNVRILPQGVIGGPYYYYWAVWIALEAH